VINSFTIQVVKTILSNVRLRELGSLAALAQYLILTPRFFLST